jgi:hypothetical protein
LLTWLKGVRYHQRAATPISCWEPFPSLHFSPQPCLLTKMPYFFLSFIGFRIV